MISRAASALLLTGMLVAGCRTHPAAAPSTGVAGVTVATTSAPAAGSSSTSPTTAAPSTVGSVVPSSTAASPTSTAVPPTTHAADFLGEQTIGTSAEGRPITAIRRGTPGGTVVLVVGVIHGDENAGLAIMEQLHAMPLPAGIDLWLVDQVNPDGYANDERHNGNGVDLNRNFPHDWTQIGEPGLWEYSGTGPASEPETRAFIAFAQRIRPELTLWYHQDLYRISPSNRRDGPLREEYARLTGLPVIAVTGGTYTGVAATWVRTTLSPSMSFIIELGPTLSASEAVVHAEAVLAISQMVARGEV